ncbi:MAG: hypothetical protein DI565_11170 [Ancylobacter novellus]|uniref:LysM domain-containing protein n=1 Tax=Ancylobacter novellus TaxID=921 RepID=A0A2W5KG22_ANCNO|nr:MAG: hypothetical protein DI565_11170 [Ancylobacter novellus]
MRSFVPSLRTRLLVRVAAIALVSGSVAACSSDSSRFGEGPFSNPFSSASNDAPPPRHQRDDAYSTGSVQAAPTSRVQRAPLGAPNAAQQRPMYGYGGGASSSNDTYRSSRVEPARPQPTYRSEPASTGSLSGGSSSGWSADAGTTVTVGRGETVTVIANRYGVPASAILRANGLSNANGVVEGSRLVIPNYSGASSAPRVAAAPAPVRPSAQLAPVRPAAAPAAVAVRPAPVRAQVAVAAPTAPAPRMQFVQGAQPKAAEAKSAAPAVKVAATLPAKPAPALKPSVPPVAEPVAAAAPAKPAPVKTAVAKPADAVDNVKTAALKVDPAPAPSVADAGPSFRWPVRGRVISGYGSKTSGASNDGVNIAVPEGTEVKASDDGVVAYSGSELKGFGNLVLIRHPNGWVTAYAHNSALNVKRGDTVRRGQIIAKSGATGSVSSPQLHFEVRKGAQTVDPMKHLPDV